MADQVGVDPAAVHATAGWLESSAHEFADDVDKLMREVRAFIGGDWQGSAADSHHDAWTDWEDGARRVIAALGQDAAALHQAAGGFVNTDGNNAAGIAAINPEAV
jgi:WXG100 family type VII secretion target